MKKLLFGLVGIALAIFVVSCNHQPPTPEEKPTTLKARINSAKAGDEIDLGEEPLTITDSDSYTITKPLTIKNGNAKNATFIVQSKGVKLESINKVDSVIVGEKVADGEFTLSNCYNIGEVYVNGGGSNSVHIANTMVDKLTVNKKNVRIALDEDKAGGVTSIGKVFVLQDCKLESEHEDNSFGSVVVAETVKTLDLAGSAAIKEIVSTAEKGADGNVNIVINVTVNVVIEAVDNTLNSDNFTAVDEKGQETTGADAFDTSKIKFEDKTEVKEDVKAEITDETNKAEEQLKPTYTIDLTPYLYDGVFYRDQWSADNYVLGFDITEAFKGNLPKNGDVLEFTINATFSETLPKMSIQFADNSGIEDEKGEINWWKQLAECTMYDDIGIEAGKEVSFTKKAAFFDEPVKQVFMQLTYDSTDSYAETVIKPKGWKGETYKIDLTKYLDFNRFSINEYSDYVASFDLSYILKDMNITRLPKKGDIMEFTLEGKFSNEIDLMKFQIGDWDSDTYKWQSLFNECYIDLKTNPIKANQPVKLTKTVGIMSDAVGYLTVNLYYSSETLNEPTIITKKDWNGTIKPLDVEQYLWEAVFPIDNYDYASYLTEFDITPLFGDSLPKAGEIYQLKFKGKFDRDISLLSANLIDNSPAANYYLNLVDYKNGTCSGIKANEEFTFDQFFIITDDAIENVIMRLFYDKYVNEKDVGEALFTSGSLDNRKKFPASYETVSGKNTVFLLAEENDEGGMKWSENNPFSWSKDDVEIGNWYKITFNVKSSFVRDESKPAYAELKLASWYGAEGSWRGDYVTAVPIKIGEKNDPVELYAYLDTPIDDFRPRCGGYNACVTFDSITLEKAPDDYEAPKTSPSNFWFKGMIEPDNHDTASYISISNNSIFTGEKVTFTYTFEKDFIEISLQANRENAGKLKIDSITIDDEPVDYWKGWGCTLEDGIVEWEAEYAQIIIDEAKAQEGSTIVIVFECL